MVPLLPPPWYNEGPQWSTSLPGEKKKAVDIDSVAGYAENVCELIGRTPMVKLNRSLPDDVVAGKVLVKLEMQNPGGSVKDRIALSMIEEAEKAGKITPGKTTLVEATSGNTGIGLAMVAAAKGYKLIVVMPQVPTMYERYVTCKKFGAEVHLTGIVKDDVKASIHKLIGYANDLCAKNPDYWSPNQFSNDDNPLAHMEHTGPEIWDQTGGEVDCFVAGCGTGGTINGVGTFLKTKKSDCNIVVVEPTESRNMLGEEPKLHGLTGLSGITGPLIEKLAPGQPWNGEKRGPIDEFAHCATPDGLAMANKLAKMEGLLVGPTSGATVKVAIDIAKRPEMKGKTIVALAASSGIRYTRHPMWAPECAEANAALPNPPDLSSVEPLVRWKSEDYVPPETK